MKTRNSNEELHSRRDFFKNAAKGVLPIIGAIVMVSVPVFTRAENSDGVTNCMGCQGKCMASCTGTCSNQCKGSCKYDCIGGCKAGCRNTCKYKCTNSNKY